MEFELHPNLAKKVWLADLALCTVLLENEKEYPWLFLVPRRAEIKKLIDLSTEEQLLLMQEMEVVQRIVWEEFRPDQLNVAAIGNKTPQLHVHVIGRFVGDPAWPGTVWDHPKRQEYTKAELEAVVVRLRSCLGASV